MSETGQPVTILSAGECWNLLASAALGRLVTSVDGQAEIFPVNFDAPTYGAKRQCREGSPW
jgi:uncharacterized protein